MNLVFSSALGWVVAVAIALPIVIMFWWARRNAPVGDYEMDYSVGRRAQPPADHVPAGLPPVVYGAADAPVPSNPAALAPPTETVAPPASTVTLPALSPLPPEPAHVATSAPAAPSALMTTPDPQAVAPTAPPTPAAVETPKPAPVATAPAVAPAAPVLPKAPAVAPKPVARAAAPAPVVARAPEPTPEPPAPPEASPAPEPAAVEPAAMEPAAMEAAAVEAAAPEPTPATADAPSTEGADDFSRLYGIDAAAAAALQGAGIVTYRQLSAANVDHLREILGGIGQAGTDPATWPQQGRFAAGGKWKILDARFKK